jgi:hypothetical protein
MRKRTSLIDRKIGDSFLSCRTLSFLSLLAFNLFIFVKHNFCFLNQTTAK